MHLLLFLSASIIIAVTLVVALPNSMQTKNIPEQVKPPKISVDPAFKREEVDSLDASRHGNNLGSSVERAF